MKTYGNFDECYVSSDWRLWLTYFKVVLTQVWTTLFTVIWCLLQSDMLPQQSVKSNTLELKKSNMLSLFWSSWLHIGDVPSWYVHLYMPSSSSVDAAKSTVKLQQHIHWSGFRWESMIWLAESLSDIFNETKLCLSKSEEYVQQHSSLFKFPKYIFCCISFVNVSRHTGKSCEEKTASLLTFVSFMIW